MKRLSTQERAGALMLAVIVVLTVCAGFFLRSCQRRTPHDMREVTVICSRETSGSDDAASRESVSRDARKIRRRSTKGPVRKKTGSAPVSRDFLSDSVKIKPRL